MDSTFSLTKRLVLTGAFSALTVVLGITRLGLIPIGALASITILQIPLILTVIILGLPEGLFVGATFGVMSLIQAAMSPTGVLDPFFVNPLCSVLPRMLVAVFAFFIWKILNKIEFLPKTFLAGICAFLSTMIHTLLVIGSLYLFNGKGMQQAMNGVGYFTLLFSLILQALLESIASTIVCSAVFASFSISKKRKSKLSKEVELNKKEQ